MPSGTTRQVVRKNCNERNVDNPARYSDIFINSTEINLFPQYERMSLMGRKKFDVIFSVIWDQPRRAFAIERDGVPTGRFFAVKSKAVEVATEAAQFESREEFKAVVYSLDSERKRVLEWSA